MAEEWPLGYHLAATQAQTLRGLLLVLVNTPLLAVAFNVIRQLVVPRRATDPPEVFYWLPFIGSAIAYGNDPIKFLFDCRKQYGEVFTFILLGRRITVALGIKGNKFILGGKSIVFNAEDAYKHLTTPVFGKDVVYDVPNPKFMEQKGFIKAGLSTTNLRAYVAMVEDEVEKFVKSNPAFQTHEISGDWGELEVVKAFQEITILTAARTLQGKEVRGSMNEEFAQMVSDLDGGFTPLNFLMPNLPLESYRRRDRAQKKMSDFYISIVRKRRAGNHEAENDIITTFLEQNYRNGDPLPDHEIAHLMIALLMAGQHTSAATGSWALLHLANNPDIAEALYNEQVQNFREPDDNLRSMTYEELRNLPILDAVIRETLRMHPPIHSIMRYVRDDVAIPPTLSNPEKDKTYIVPKGNYVLASPAVSQMDPEIWEDPEHWNPLRWTDPDSAAAQAIKTELDDNGKKIDYGFGSVSKGAESPYQPFGAGKHRCIGEQFSYMQLGTIITTIVRNFELRIDAVPQPDYHIMITLPKTPRTISYRPRKVD